MAAPKVLALILAGGEGGRLEVLAEERAKPAMPFAGVYRLIDFSLSNCMHSGISDVWLLQQYQPHSLTEHIANGRPWDLDRTHGGLRLLQPYQGRSESGWYRGNADALYRNKTEIARFDPDLLLVMSADHLYKLDYRDVVAAHLEHDGIATLVSTKVRREEAGRFGVVQVDGGRVTDFAYKPDEPRSDLVTTEVFMYSARELIETLDELAPDDIDENEESSLRDFGHELLPHLVERGQAFDFRLDGYWRDLGTVESYWEAHMELLEPERTLWLDAPEWPIYTRSAQRPPARVATGARVEDSLLSPGCEVYGRVERSVLGPGVVVQEGAEIREVVLLQDAAVRPGARVANAVIDSDVEIGARARVGGEGRIAVLGQAARLGAGAEVPPGSSVRPGGTEGDVKERESPS